MGIADRSDVEWNGLPLTEQKVAVMVPLPHKVAEEAEEMRGHLDEAQRRLMHGYTVLGPSEPRLLSDLPEWDEDASPEWKALYEIASGGYDEDATEMALEVIGVPRWEPGPVPGFRPGLVAALDGRLSA